MHRFLWHSGQLRQPVTNKPPRFIEAFSLGRRVKNTKIGRGIGTRGGRPLPAAVIRRQIAINKLFDKVALAQPPVDSQVFHQEAGDNHPQAIMHPPCGIKLTHGGIDNRETGLPALPGLKRGFIIQPRHVIGPADKRATFTQVWVVNHQMTVKLAPDKLVEPYCPGFAIQRPRLLNQQTVQALARRERAHRQARRQPAGSFDGGKIALLFIIGGFLLAETAEPGDSAFFIRGEQLAIKGRLRIVYFHIRGGSDGATRADFRRGDALGQRFL